MSPSVIRTFRYDEYRNVCEFGKKRHAIFDVVDDVYSIITMFNPFSDSKKYSVTQRTYKTVDINVYSLQGLKKCAKKYGNSINHISILFKNELTFDIKDIIEYVPDVRSLFLPVSATNLNSINLLNDLKQINNIYISSYLNEKLDFDGNETIKVLGIRYSDLKNGIPHMPNLQVLHIDNFNQSDVCEISRCPNLRKLRIIKSQKLENLHGISNLKHLEYVMLYGLRKLKSLENINNLEKLQYLLLKRCRNLSDLSGLSGSKMLEYLYFYECNNLGDLRPLKSCQNLVDLHLRVETNVDPSYEEVVSALPNLRYTSTDLSRSRKSM